MSIAVFNSQLQVKLATGGWQACAPVAANTWYHVVVAKQPGEARVYLNGSRVFTGGLVNFSEPWMNITIGGMLASNLRRDSTFSEVSQTSSLSVFRAAAWSSRPKLRVLWTLRSTYSSLTKSAHLSTQNWRSAR